MVHAEGTIYREKVKAMSVKMCTFGELLEAGYTNKGTIKDSTYCPPVGTFLSDFIKTGYTLKINGRSDDQLFPLSEISEFPNIVLSKTFTIINSTGTGTTYGLTCTIGGTSQGSLAGGDSAEYTITRGKSMVIEVNGMFINGTEFAVYDSRDTQVTDSVSTSSSVTMSYSDIEDGETYTVSTGITHSPKTITLKNLTGMILTLSDGLQMAVNASTSYTLNSGETLTIKTSNNTEINCSGGILDKSGTSITLSYSEVMDGLTYAFTVSSLTDTYIVLTIYPNNVPYGTYSYKTSNSSSWTTIGTISSSSRYPLTAQITYTAGESISIHNSRQGLEGYCLENSKRQKTTSGSADLYLAANSFSNGDSFSIVSQS